jgi:hypothetical protein
VQAQQIASNCHSCGKQLPLRQRDDISSAGGVIKILNGVPATTANTDVTA